MNLANRVAFVSGASRGLGEQFARALAGAGASVVVTSRTLAALDPLQDALGQAGQHQCLPVQLDVRCLESIQSAVGAAVDHFGRIDILINNAGCNRRKPALEVTWDDWNTILETNLRGPFFLAQSVVAQAMAPQRYGRIINIGSVTSVHGYAGLAPYGASRGGIKQMTMSLADDWGRLGITVNCLAPGWFKTAQNAVLYEDREWVSYLRERIPLGRPGEPGDLDGALLFLASDASAYVTGQTLLVDGGISTGSIRALPKG